ncbi:MULTISPECIES: hypothetical protein [Nocardioides]|uniref:Uncharacterized protein n=1 Tax=Nocardioides vastitatis TaxID=2568655 RepID=A0ABW0ZHX7_9ACTN|nr:hypothetical protein [Nocardioides sp.]THJ00540.1 hypothetical protein E7Z54_11825 [Nocardioides sp.]
MEKRSKRKIGVRAAVVAGVAAAMIIGAGGGAVSAALITSAKIKDNTIQSRDIRNGTIKAVDVAPDSIPGGDLRNGTVTGADVANGSISSADLGPNARTYWVAGRADGTLDRSSGAGISVAKVNTGRYDVTLPAGVDVGDCGIFAARGRAANFNGTVGFVSASPNYLNLPNRVWVETWNSGAAHTDADFYLLVDC